MKELPQIDMLLCQNLKCQNCVGILFTQPNGMLLPENHCTQQAPEDGETPTLRTWGAKVPSNCHNVLEYMAVNAKEEGWI